MNARLEELVDGVERNDAARAAQVADAIAQELGAVPGRTVYYLSMLQDDPAEFLRRIEGIPVKADRGAV